MSNYNKKTKINVEIRNRTYTIVGSESEAHVQDVAERVDEKMDEIHQANPKLDTTHLSVLTAINTMNEYLKTEEIIEENKALKKDLADQAKLEKSVQDYDELYKSRSEERRVGKMCRVRRQR